MHPIAAQQLQKLYRIVPTLDPPMQETLLVFLAVITSCLEIDEDKRPMAQTLARQLQTMHERLERELPSEILQSVEKKKEPG